MKNYYLKSFIKKIVEISLSLIFVTLLSFLLMRLSPIDAATAYVKRNTAIVTQEQIMQARIQMGLDKPLLIQYGSWLKKALHFDFGVSLASGHSVTYEMGRAIPVTLWVVFHASYIMIIGVIIFGCLGFLLRKNKLRYILIVLGIGGISIPSFYLATLFIDIFAIRLKWLNVVGNTGVTRYIPASICLSISGIAFYAQFLKQSIVREMEEEYVFFARSRGLKEGHILIFHVLPHVLTHIIPNFMQMLGLCLAGAAIIERVFSLPGLGYLIIDSVIKRDFPVIHVAVLFLACLFVLLNVLSDMLEQLLKKDQKVKEVEIG